MLDVPEPKLYLPDGDAYFPVGFSKHQALVRGDDPEDIKLPEIALKNVPFPLEGGIASPSTPGPKARSVYITLDRIISLRKLPDVKVVQIRLVTTHLNVVPGSKSWLMKRKNWLRSPK